MKKILLSLFVVLHLLGARANEGMWLPMLLGEQVYKDMVKNGLKLKAEQLYSINQASIKDAIVIFGGGCTGEIVSDKGLIFTNHHCGYGAIASASNVENNYLKNGFWASGLNGEIPSKGLSVRFLSRIDDVTDRVLGVLGTTEGAERNSKFSQISGEIVKETVGADEFTSAVVAPIFKGRQYLLYVYQVYKDVRLVGAPPESIGKFGGDTDNWEWPRHTGDFSVFRVYMSKDGKAANYSADNIPLKPKYFLPVSIKGFKDGDYSMIFGYPGSTNRYETSYGVKLSTDINNPTLVKLRTVRLKYMLDEMRKSEANRLQLASEYASLANYWKFYDGETKQLIKYDIYGKKKKQEEEFAAWAQGKPVYQSLFADFASAYETWRPYAELRQYMLEGITGCRLIGTAAALQDLEATLSQTEINQDALDKAIVRVESIRKNYLASYSTRADQNILASVLSMFFSDVDPALHPAGFYENLFATYNDIEENPFKAYAEDVFTNTLLLNTQKWEAFKVKPSLDALNQDPAFNLVGVFIKSYIEKYQPRYLEFNTKNEQLSARYMQGLFEMYPDKMKSTYPDANFTMRVSYGQVKSYSPRDAVIYDDVCTLSGVMAKYKPGDYEFDLPAKLLDLHKQRDFGPYADPAYKDIVVCFITTNDITGGNSGSPVLNAKGELIGLAFDGNYEALSHKLAFDQDLNRTMCVDIRYVLWCIEKLGGAGYLIEELKIN